MTMNRRELEAAVSSTASSVDGRRFTFQCSVHDLELQPGGYVSVDGRLGQVHALDSAWVEGAELEAAVTEEVQDASRTRIALVRGHGILLEDGDGPFHEVHVERAGASTIAGSSSRSVTTSSSCA